MERLSVWPVAGVVNPMPTFRTPFADMYIALVLLNDGMAKQTVGRRLAYRGSLRPQLFVWLLYHKKNAKWPHNIHALLHALSNYSASNAVNRDCYVTHKRSSVFSKETK